ncbi:Glycogen synthase [Aquisphaera giovannonii]|uniref:Glycogen synthase n=1 Tax=Aquisphaera giovannonii TaxID=406548 RepID=A0A5B9VUS7_9BACT|nr:glycosyltransferase family 4 protein [Aquisphaera giovannonii]QEH32008.1 Glycogen synthase [Aquisphaera giovannonii]
MNANAHTNADGGQPLKLALITRRYPPLIGGAEKVLSYLAEALAREGADVTVLTSRAPGLEALPAEEELAIEGRRGAGRLRVVRLATSPVRFLGTWLYMRSLARWLGEHPVDLAYVSMLKHDAYVAVGAGRRRGFPVVLRPEGAGATGDLAWQSWGRFGRRIGARCKEADAIVAISREIDRELRQAGYDPSTIRPLPNGVPVPAQSWQKRPGWRDAPRASYVGRLAPEKGIDTLVAAWPSVREAHPGARLTLVGEGPQRPALEAQARGLGLELGPSGAIDLPGASSDVAGELRRSDLFVLPSREEGMSVALLEAMALGIPLVASSIPGNRRLVADFKHGRLAPPDDPAALARTILDQWANLDRAFHMGRAARSRVRDEFSIAAVARRHLALFRQLAARGTRPATEDAAGSGSTEGKT